MVHACGADGEPDRKRAFYADPDVKPAISPPDLGGIPAGLKAAPRWVAWKFVWNDRKKVWDKVPVNPRTGRNAKANKPETWGTFAEASAALASNPDLAGIGYVFEK